MRTLGFNMKKGDVLELLHKYDEDDPHSAGIRLTRMSERLCR
jgi:hypothetical protein